MGINMLSFDDFLDIPNDKCVQYVPSTMVYAPSGTRRRAVLAGFAPDSDEYASWSKSQMIEACRLIFDHGVRHVITVLAMPQQFQETGVYRSRLLDWIRWGIGGPEALRDYRCFGWAARIICDPSLELLVELDRWLQQHPATADSRSTLWYVVVRNSGSLWHAAADRLTRMDVTSEAQAIRSLYGTDIPPAELFLGFGKPVISSELVPPFLLGNMHCYWSQRPGYSLTKSEFRQILYDFAILRSVQDENKPRAAPVTTQAELWDNSAIIGLGSVLALSGTQKSVKTSSETLMVSSDSVFHLEHVMTIEAIIFDRDGVLTRFDVDAADQFLQSVASISSYEIMSRWQAWGDEVGFPRSVDEESRFLSGFWKRVGQELGLTHAQINELNDLDYTSFMRVYPEVERMLIYLRNKAAYWCTL